MNRFVSSPFGVRPIRRAVVSSFLAGVLGSAAAPSALADGQPAATAAPVATAPLTREQVVEDLAAYRRSGLSEFDSAESDPDVWSDSWRAARMRYLVDRMQWAGRKPQAPKSREEVEADLKAYQESGLAALEQQDSDSADYAQALKTARARYAELTMMHVMAPHPLSRAEVKADLEIYRESGLAALDRAEGASGADPLARSQALERYQALKTGGRYASLVAELGASEGSGGQ